MPRLGARTAAGVVIALLVLAGGIAWWAPWDSEPKPVREVIVGLYENEPKIYTDDEGRPAGLFPELLEEIAEQNRWQLRWVDCEFATCLDLLEQGELDLMPDVAFNAERDALFDFHAQSVVNSWSQVFTVSGSEVSTVEDLAGSRVAVFRGGVGQAGLRELTEEAGVGLTEVLVDTFGEGYQAVVEGKADAVVSNRFFASSSQDYELSETPIIFRPSALYYATAKGEDQDLLDGIDSSLTQWRVDPDSVYFDIVDHALTSTPMEKEVPRWLMWALPILGGVVLFVGITALVLRREVRHRTRDLLRTTEELAAERANLKDQVEQRSVELKAAKEEAEHLTHVKSDFLANMSHEIRTPLNAILGMLYLALRNDLSPAVRNYLTKTQTSAQNLLGIINDILDISKIESGRIDLEHIEFSLESVMAQLADSVRILMDNGDVEFMIRYDPEIPAVLVGDPLRVGPDPAQPLLQRDQVHRTRPGRGVRPVPACRGGLRHPAGFGEGLRHRDDGRTAGKPVPELHPGRPVNDPPLRRHGTRAGDQQTPQRDDGGPHLDRELSARTGNDDLLHDAPRSGRRRHRTSARGDGPGRALAPQRQGAGRRRQRRLAARYSSNSWVTSTSTRVPQPAAATPSPSSFLHLRLST